MIRDTRRFAGALLGICPFISICGGAQRAAAENAPRQRMLLNSDKAVTAEFDNLSATSYYAVLMSVPILSVLAEPDRIDVVVEDAAGEVVRKRLHAGDADLYFTLKPRKDGAGKVVATATGTPGKTYELSAAIQLIPLSGKSNAIIAAGPNSTWQTAQPIELGTTVYAGNDERPYIPSADGPESTFKDLLAGAQWFTFTYTKESPALVHFIIDMLDREVPVNVTIFTHQSEPPTQVGGRSDLVPYEEGIERFVPEQSTSFHGLYKLAARTIKPGTYYIRVMGNHPAYQLRTDVYDSPPYLKPGVTREEAARKAIRVGMDYLIRKGDSWHANTPRRGGVVLRTSTALQETQLCIACHPTHFTTRGELVAVENGWPVRERQAMKFLTERLYNNPRPIYGLPDTAWVRVISAPGSVISRMAYMAGEFEKRISHEQRAGIMDDEVHLLERYWVGVEHPITESNGNAPRVSGFEIALHSWLVFDEQYRRTRDAKYLDFRWRCEKVVHDNDPIDMLDLSWKAVGLATFDRDLYADEIRAIVARIFSYQKPDGTWPMAFGEKSVGFDYYAKKHTEMATPLAPDGKPMYSEFQTYHSIYALAKCGVTLKDERLAKAVDWCLARQWSHGGWQGNTDYKNFDTVFRETQFAVMALSQLYPGPGSDGWMAAFPPAPASIPLDSVDDTLAALQQYWQTPDTKVLEQVRAALSHPQPLVREAAAQCLGRIADADSLPQLAKALGDPSKMVQRAAAAAIREIATRQGPRQLVAAHDIILAALNSKDDRTRWGATMIFNQHFRYLAQDTALIPALVERMQHDPAVIVRMTAAQALSKWWFWLKDTQPRVPIEKAFTDAMAHPEHPWVRRALIEGFRNMQDDNTRYLYNTWTVAMKRPEDQKTVEAAHKRSVYEQAQRILDVLKNGNDLQRDGVLRSFYTFHLQEGAGDLNLIAKVTLPETFLREGTAERGENKWLDGYKAAVTYDPLTMGTGTNARLGNDSEPPEYQDDSGPLIAQALAAVLRPEAGGAAPLNAGVLKALRQTRGVPVGPDFSVALVRLTANLSPMPIREGSDNQPPPVTKAKSEPLTPVRGRPRPARRKPKAPAAAAAISAPSPSAAKAGDQSAEIYALLRELLPTRISDGPAVFQPMADLIAKGSGEALGVAGAVLANPGTAAIANSPAVSDALKKRLVAAPIDDPDLPALIACATRVTAIQDEEAFTAKLFAVMESDPSAAKESVARLMIASPKFLAAGEARKQFEGMMRTADKDLMLLLLKVAAGGDFSRPDSELGLNLALGIVTTALNHDDAGVKLKAVDTVRAIPKIQTNPAVVTAVRELAKEEGQASASAKTLLASFDARGKLAGKNVSDLLDFQFFAKKVQPILQTRGEDRNACVMCHANHSILRLNEPDADGRLTAAQLRENYRNATKVVDLSQPEDSLILRKPTSPFDGIGVPGAYLRTHGGDIRWPDGKNSEQYRTILQWIQGAKVTTTTRPATSRPAKVAQVRADERK